jgi:hypothetical protein
MGAALSGGHGAGVAAQGRCRDRAGGIGGLPQIGHQRAQGGVAGVRPKFIRVPITERMSQAFYLHAAVRVLRFRRACRQAAFRRLAALRGKRTRPLIGMTGRCGRADYPVLCQGDHLAGCAGSAPERRFSALWEKPQ